jgi:hypothetical protein
MNIIVKCKTGYFNKDDNNEGKVIRICVLTCHSYATSANLIWAVAKKILIAEGIKASRVS